MKKSTLLLLILLGISGRVFAQATDREATVKGIEGAWHGTLDVGGPKLRLVLTVTKSGDGVFSGKMDSIDQGAVIPVETITVSGDSVRLELKTVGAAYEGTLDQNRSEMTGKFSQGGNTFPLTFSRSDKSPAPATGAAATQQRPIDVPVDVLVPVSPTAFKANGKMHLVYEIHVTNFGRGDCTLTRAEVIGGDAQKKILARYEEDDLPGRLNRPGMPAMTGAEKSKIGSGLRAIVYVWVTVGTAAEVPAALRHRLSFKVGDYPEEMTVETAGVSVGKELIMIAPPLRGGEWLAANGPSDTSGHRRALIPVGGGAHIAQRFAIDYVQLREEGRTFSGDPKDNKNYRCYGAEALAVADATVVAVKDGIPENIPGANSRAVPITLETVGGNHVILDLGKGRYAFYAHLQPGKIRVKVGDKVRRGQVLGLVGNSGNSTEPHLHFHVSNDNSPLASEGLPYSLPSFEVQGKGWGWKPSGANLTTEKRQVEMPLDAEVVRFPSNP